MFPLSCEKGDVFGSLIFSQILGKNLWLKTSGWPPFIRNVPEFPLLFDDLLSIWELFQKVISDCNTSTHRDICLWVAKGVVCRQVLAAGHSSAVLFWCSHAAPSLSCSTRAFPGRVRKRHSCMSKSPPFLPVCESNLCQLGFACTFFFVSHCYSAATAADCNKLSLPASVRRRTEPFCWGAKSKTQDHVSSLEEKQGEEKTDPAPSTEASFYILVSGVALLVILVHFNIWKFRESKKDVWKHWSTFGWVSWSLYYYCRKVLSSLLTFFIYLFWTVMGSLHDCVCSRVCLCVCFTLAWR